MVSEPLTIDQRLRKSFDWFPCERCRSYNLKWRAAGVVCRACGWSIPMGDAKATDAWFRRAA